MADALKWVVLAHVLRPQGRKGEVLAELLTDFPERFQGRQIFLAAAEFDGPPEAADKAEVTAYWLPVGKNLGRVVLKLVGIDSISDAEKICGQDLLVPVEDRVPLEDDTNYISDLIGCMVFDGAVAVGVVEDVQFATTADGQRRLEESAPMLVLRSGEGLEVLVPFAKEFVVKTEPERKRVEMRLPVGLVDVNRQ